MAKVEGTIQNGSKMGTAKLLTKASVCQCWSGNINTAIKRSTFFGIFGAVGSFTPRSNFRPQISGDFGFASFVFQLDSEDAAGSVGQETGEVYQLRPDFVILHGWY